MEAIQLKTGGGATQIVVVKHLKVHYFLLPEPCVVHYPAYHMGYHPLVMIVCENNFHVFMAKLS